MYEFKVNLSANHGSAVPLDDSNIDSTMKQDGQKSLLCLIPLMIYRFDQTVPIYLGRSKD